MTVKELKKALENLDENKKVKLLNDITFTAETYRSPEMSHEFPFKVEDVEEVTEGEDKQEKVVFIHAVAGNLY